EAHLAVLGAEGEHLPAARRLRGAPVQGEADRIEQAALARTGVAGDHHQLVRPPVDPGPVIGAEGRELEFQRPHRSPPAAASASANAWARRGSRVRPVSAYQAA